MLRILLISGYLIASITVFAMGRLITGFDDYNFSPWDSVLTWMSVVIMIGIFIMMLKSINSLKKMLILLFVGLLSGVSLVAIDFMQDSVMSSKFYVNNEDLTLQEYFLFKNDEFHSVLESGIDFKNEYSCLNNALDHSYRNILTELGVVCIADFNDRIEFITSYGGSDYNGKLIEYEGYMYLKGQTNLVIIPDRYSELGSNWYTIRETYVGLLCDECDI